MYNESSSLRESLTLGILSHEITTVEYLPLTIGSPQYYSHLRFVL